MEAIEDHISLQMKGLKILEDVTALSHYAAGHFISVVDNAIQRNGYSSVALSGGSPPKQMYSLLAGERFNQKISWERVHLFWGDECCVPSDHQDINFFMAKKNCLIMYPSRGEMYTVSKVSWHRSRQLLNTQKNFSLSFR